MTMRARDLIVVGASAGGVEALRAFAAGLPADLPAAVLVVLHLPAGGTSALPAILARSGPLPAAAARPGERPSPGRIYVARPDHHLLLLDDELVLSHGPTENGHRPAVNALFRSAAIARGPAVTGVLLSGALDDGVAGLVSIAGRGGITMVQDPAEALYPGMPEQALRHVQVDYVLPAAEMGTALVKITQEAVDPDTAPPPSDLLTLEHQVMTNAKVADGSGGQNAPGWQSSFSCPDCQGVLVEVEPGRYRCEVGHAWTADALLEAQGSAWERALWAALRTLDEKVRLGQRMAGQARARGSDTLADRYLASADEAEGAAEILRSYLTGRGGPGKEAVS
jgi:two-component system chemotaxis response regulator CheB